MLSTLLVVLLISYELFWRLLVPLLCDHAIVRWNPLAWAFCGFPSNLPSKYFASLAESVVAASFMSAFEASKAPTETYFETNATAWGQKYMPQSLAPECLDSYLAPPRIDS